MLVRYIMIGRQLHGSLRAMFFGAAVGVAGCLFREIEFDQDGPYGWLDWMFRVPGRIGAVMVGLPVVFFAIKGALRCPGALPRMAFMTCWGRWGCLGMVFLFVAAGIDQRVFNKSGAIGWEESIETLGYLLLAVSSFIPTDLAKSCEYPTTLQSQSSRL